MQVLQETMHGAKPEVVQMIVDIVSLKAGIVIPLLGNMALCSMLYCLVVRICLRLVRTCVGVVWLCRRVIGPYCSSNVKYEALLSYNHPQRHGLCEQCIAITHTIAEYSKYALD